MALTHCFTVLRHAKNLASCINKVGVRCVSRYHKIDENVYGLNDEQKEVSNYHYYYSCVLE